MSESIDVLISFDTTGSMYPCIGQVRRNVEELVGRLFKDIPEIRLGVIAHGDYCDGPDMIKSVELTTDKKKLVNFIRNVPNTNGGDLPECYEYVLHIARQAAWQAGKNRVLVMIGDAVPHPANHYDNTKKLDWKNEAKLLSEMGIKIYSVQALGYLASKYFWKDLSTLTDGYYLQLNQFAQISDLILAVCYKQKSDIALQQFEDEISNSGKMSRGTDEIIGTLLGRKKSTRYKTSVADLGAVPNGRFQVLYVDRDIAIKDFVLENGLRFEKGRGFYEFVKSTKIQDYKEVILMHRESGDLFTGDRARAMAGIPVGVSTNVRPVKLSDYVVFVQSTSVNRKLIGGTKFLYEVEGWVD